MIRRKGGKLSRVWPVALLAAAVLILICFSSALGNLEQGRDAEGKRQLEDALRRAAVSCYAAEGIYPPDLEYMTEHYGIQINEEKYFVHYEPIAENLMPGITVISRDE